MSNRIKSYKNIWLSTDLLIISVNFFLGELLFADCVSVHVTISDILFLLFLWVVWFFTSSSTKLYDEFRSNNFSFELIALIKTALIQTIAGIIILFFFFKGDNKLSRVFILVFSASSFICLFFKKFFIRKSFDIRRARGRNLRNVLIIGAGRVGLRFYSTIILNKHFGYQLVGFLDDRSLELEDNKYLGTIDILEDVLDKYNVNDVIIALPNYAFERVEEAISICENKTVRIRIIPDYFRHLSSKYKLSNFGNFPVISVRELPLDEIQNKLFKKAFDIVITVLAFMLLFWWLWPIIAILIKLNSKGPIFFKQERWGLDNKPIMCYKFRSMSSASIDFDENGKFKQASKNDTRITSFGKFLRRSNLDELPQFYNVLKGEMSIIGPRPHAVPHNIELKKDISKYLQRHLVKPGISGWAQISGYRGEAKTTELMQKRVEYDIWYIENWSLWLDIQICFYTVWKMLKGDKNAY